MDKIEKRKLYLKHLEEINEGVSREKKIQEALKKIHKFVINKDIIDFLIEHVVDKDTSKGVKYLVWIANLLVDDIITKKKPEYAIYQQKRFQENLESYIKTGNVNHIKIDFDNYIHEQLNTDYDDYFDTVSSGLKVVHIMDWIKSPLRQEELDLSKYKTLQEAFEEAKAWHEELDATGHIDEEHGKVIKKFDDGWYWIDLQTKEDLDEAKAMGHCGVTTQGTTLYSLRKSNSPHVTMAVDTESGFITQCKGRHNEKPIKKYHKYIVDLMIDENFPAEKFYLEYDTGDDFDINDLDNDLYKKLLYNNIKWLEIYPDCIKRFYETFKDDLEIFKKIKDSDILLFLCKLDLEHGGNLIDSLKSLFEIQMTNFSNTYENHEVNKIFLKLDGDDIIIERSLSYHNFYLEYINFYIKTSQNASHEEVKAYEEILGNFYKLPFVIELVKDNAEYFVFANTISTYNLDKKLSLKPNIGKNGLINLSYKLSIPKITELVKEFVDQPQFMIKMKDEQKSILKYIKDEFGVELDISEPNYIKSKLNFKDFLKQIEFRNNTIDVVLRWEQLKKEEIKNSNSKYIVKYDFLTELNNYILEKMNITESLVNEKFGAPDDIEEWYNLIYYIISVQCQGFIEAVQQSPEKFKDKIEIGEDGEDSTIVFNCDVTLDTTTSNKLVEEYISKDNKLKLRDMTVSLSITILTEEYFSNYFFDNDANYNSLNAEYDGEFLRDVDFFLQVYLPTAALGKDAVLTDIMNDYEITMKLRQSISHELDHAYEFFNRTKAGEIEFTEKSLMGIQAKLQNDEFSQIANHFYNFLSMCYFALTFEGSARVTELHYIFKEMDEIENAEQYWSVVKDSNAWKEMMSLKEFDPVSFYNSMTFEMSDEDIKEVLIMTKINTEEDFKKYSVKDLVLRHWLNLFDDMIKLVNEENPRLNVKRINKQMMDHPLLFFKYYDKKFKKSWEYFYKRVMKMSVLYIKH